MRDAEAVLRCGDGIQLMKANLKLIPVILLMAVTGLLTACYEDPKQMVLHDAGQYRGKSDDLAALSERKAILQDRFHQVQTDR